MDEPWIEYELWQGGVCVANCSGPPSTRDRLFADILHYAQQYAQDGPCEVRGPKVCEEFFTDDDCQ
jgi:hypothetical protein